MMPLKGKSDHSILLFITLVWFLRLRVKVHEPKHMMEVQGRLPPNIPLWDIGYFELFKNRQRKKDILTLLCSSESRK